MILIEGRLLLYGGSLSFLILWSDGITVNQKWIGDNLSRTKGDRIKNMASFSKIAIREERAKPYNGEGAEGLQRSKPRVVLISVGGTDIKTTCGFDLRRGKDEECISSLSPF